jgi:two-component system, cell cycle sensor histidine kinase and response regulator CckA
VSRLLEEAFPKTIEVVLLLTAEQPVVMGDTNQLHQVFMNLCVNARDAMPTGGTLTIATQIVGTEVVAAKYERASECDYISIGVSDSGIGMNEETQSHAFDPFFTTKEKGKGTGLGLAVVSGIVEKHGGFVEIQSKLHMGTTFQVFLPSASERFAAGEKYPQEAVNVPGGDETILFVEDEAMTREVVCEWLEKKGYKVFAAGDGKEALTIYEAEAPRIDLVLSDLGLPKLDGGELCSCIRKSGRDIPFLLCSGYLDPDKKGKLSEAGVDEMIQKPYKMEDLLTRIRSHCDRRRS